MSIGRLGWPRQSQPAQPGGESARARFPRRSHVPARNVDFRSSLSSIVVHGDLDRSSEGNQRPWKLAGRCGTIGMGRGCDWL